MSRGAHWNRNNRRSGGDPLAKIVVGDSQRTQRPVLTIQCFEGRHSECWGYDHLFGGAPCECACHSPQSGDGNG